MEMKIVYKKVTDLIPYENNPRKNENAVQKVAESIKTFGFKVPITVDPEMVVVTGHTRLKAAIRLGLEEVPVIVLDNLTPDQIKAFRLVDNKTSEYAQWDMEALAIELKDIDLDLSIFDFEDMPGAEATTFDDDYIIEVPKIPKSKLGDIYQLGNHKVMCGDATDLEDVALLMANDVADLFITDPPYNVNYGAKGELYKTKGGYDVGFQDRRILNDNMDDASFLAFLSNAFIAANTVLKKGGVFYIWHSDLESLIFRLACRNTEWQVRQNLIWNKNAMVIGRQDYQWKHEPCLYGWKDGAAHYFIDDRTYTTVIEDAKKLNINKLKLTEAKELLRALLEPEIATTVIDAPKPTSSAEHPTMKPIQILGRFISNSSKKGQLVLDTFGGSGSTIIAAEQLKRRCNMMELDPRFVDVIIDRYQKLTGGTVVKIREGGPEA